MLSQKIEKVLQAMIFQDLKKGRKDFDLPHTKAVVYWMKHLLTSDPQVKELVATKKINPKVMITAAYAHDWGYLGLFENDTSNSLQNILDKKKLHMTKGSAMIERLLYSKLSKEFSAQEILQISHLVLFHDKLEKIQTQAEFLLMEADTLGMLDLERITPTFSKEDREWFLKTSINELRLPLFKHKYALGIAQVMAKKYENLT